MNTADKFGYYMVNNQKYTSKQLAILESRKTGKPMQYLFNDEVYSCFDWTKEPEPHVPLWEFYRRRAQQLRDNYDYVIVQFSGGPDSANVLDAFVRNNIKVDEIVNFNSFDKTQVVDGTLNNADYVYNVKPILDEFLKGHKATETVITILDEIDITKKIWDDYDNLHMAHDFLLGGSWSASSWMFKGVWVKHVKHIWDRVLAGQRVCVILGNDKTPLFLDEQNRHYTWFQDLNGADTCNILTHDPDLRGTNIIEWFYDTPDMPTLAIKQAHVLKKFVDMSIADSFEDISKLEDTDFRPSFVCKSKIHPGNLKYDLYHKTIYPNWSPVIVTPKPKYHGSRTRDTWWAKQLPSDQQKIWQHNFVHMWRLFKDLIPRSKTGEFGALPSTPTRKYYLE